MSLSDLTDNFRVANNEGWYGAFGLTLGEGGTPPWTGLPAWSPLASYGATSACVYGGDLYVARPYPALPGWTSSATFDGDVAPDGYSRWLHVGYARAWSQRPYDLTGASVTFAIKAIDPSGILISSDAELSASTEDGGVIITNAANGGVALSIAPSRTQSVPAGLYVYDYVVTKPDGRKDRVRYGQWLVDEGVAG